MKSPTELALDLCPDLKARTSSKGSVLLRYALMDGTPGTGDMSATDRGA